ncbi:Leucine-rich_repeat domain superfamily [Hexamita inflata]|uniref:Leucine-rich repeat domain superfamily n=1 Tax=Hexamita inflata TaxID=28002 RepID=A0AA86N9C4_9EUKA|nr:Leucine-rich repeat domain superfamily [Hexamita inflata]
MQLVDCCSLLKSLRISADFMDTLFLSSSTWSTKLVDVSFECLSTSLIQLIKSSRSLSFSSVLNRFNNVYFYWRCNILMHLFSSSAKSSPNESYTCIDYDMLMLVLLKDVLGRTYKLLYKSSELLITLGLVRLAKDKFVAFDPVILALTCTTGLHCIYFSIFDELFRFLGENIYGIQTYQTLIFICAEFSIYEFNINHVFDSSTMYYSVNFPHQINTITIRADIYYYKQAVNTVEYQIWRKNHLQHTQCSDITLFTFSCLKQVTGIKQKNNTQIFNTQQNFLFRSFQIKNANFHTRLMEQQQHQECINYHDPYTAARVQRHQNDVKNGELIVWFDSTLQNLDFTKHLYISKLIVDHCDNVILSPLPYITELFLISCNLTTLNNLPLNIVSLDITNNKIVDLSALSQIKTLKKLQIDGNKNLNLNTLNNNNITELQMDF